MYEAMAEKWGAVFHVPPSWILAVIQTESSGNPQAFNPEKEGSEDDSRGLMQIQFRTAKALGFRGEPEELFDADTNIYWGAKAIQEIVNRIGSGDAKRFYSAYNSGNPDRYKTSAQVAVNVERFERNLAYATGVPVDGATPAPSSAVPVLVALALGIFLFR